MKNYHQYSGMNHETIDKLSMKIKDLNKDYSHISGLLKEISKYLSKVDLLNHELGTHSNLFQIIDKDDEFQIHLKKSIMASLFLKKCVHEIIGISNKEINLSFEELNSILINSLGLLKDKLKLENTFNTYQSNSEEYK